MTASTLCPPVSSPSETAHSGMPRAKLAVPSIGSSTQRGPAGAPLRPCSSPSIPISGVSRARKDRTSSSTARATSVTRSRSPLAVIEAGGRERAIRGGRGAASRARGGGRRGLSGAAAAGSPAEAVLLAQQPDPRRSARREGPDLVLDRQVDVGDQVAVALGGDRGGRARADDPAGAGDGLAREGQQPARAVGAVRAVHRGLLPRRARRG